MNKETEAQTSEEFSLATWIENGKTRFLIQ